MLWELRADTIAFVFAVSTMSLAFFIASGPSSTLQECGP